MKKKRKTQEKKIMANDSSFVLVVAVIILFFALMFMLFVSPQDVDPFTPGSQSSLIDWDPLTSGYQPFQRQEISRFDRFSI